MVVFPNAKINLGLWIKNKRPDGFHEIETCFYPVPLHEILEIMEVEPGNEVFRTTGLNIPAKVEDNLVKKAYELLKKDYYFPPLHIHLHKTIPMGSGLGGGSSDAAFAIKLLNEHFKLGMDEQQMRAYARQIGSDCAFFILNKPAIATGRGELLKPIALSLSGFYIAIVIPPTAISTTWAYSSIAPRPRKNSLEEIINLPVKEWKNRLENDFENAVFKKNPEVEVLKNILYDQGADYASLTGSGSGIFGLFSNDPGILEAKSQYFLWQRKL
ncbi:MAG: 4-(cytidine 5'-diphospho)-2-C-methyl-D-erythritol kinase [Bacteroidales bacterium]|nr:4-(cytidine 5'-diphospho)-2-C-methyl-D-erythritol kinase [Bacteroidales bacterium]MDZ4205476.1 4-(cytidine 5'-diphospho)-2-C-methyl-D-erythritol kinase [Bacteroidales bacterium]